jgi:outer membrane lipoprotein SlyB
MSHSPFRRAGRLLVAGAFVMLVACTSQPIVPLGERPMPYYRDGVVEQVRDFTVTDYGSRAPAGGGGVSVGVGGGTGGRSGGGIGIGFGFPIGGFGASSAPTSTRVYDITVKLDNGETIIVRQLPTEPAPANGERVRVITEDGVSRVTSLKGN